MRHHPILAFWFVWGAFITGTAHSAVNDIFPTDAVALHDGAVNMAFYAVHREQQGPYAHGSKLMDGQVNIDVAAMRISRHFHLNETYSFAPVAVFSLSRAETSPQPLSNLIGSQATGMGDLRLGGSFWFLRDQEKRRYAAINLITSLPTGDYNENRLLNIGENRWKWVLGGGLLWSLGERWVLDLAPEIAWYGDNDEYAGRRKLSQEASVALTGYLRYRVTPQLHLMAGAQVNRAGATSINGVDQHNAPENTRLSLGLFYLTEDRQQWQIRYSRDAHVEDGFRTADELSLRYSIVY